MSFTKHDCLAAVSLPISDVEAVSESGELFDLVLPMILPPVTSRQSHRHSSLLFRHLCRRHDPFLHRSSDRPNLLLLLSVLHEIMSACVSALLVVDQCVVARTSLMHKQDPVAVAYGFLWLASVGESLWFCHA